MIQIGSSVSAENMFGKDWKQNLFFEKGYLNKQICSIVVISSVFYFALLDLEQAKHKGFAAIVLTYALLSLASFLSLKFVTDF